MKSNSLIDTNNEMDEKIIQTKRSIILAPAEDFLAEGSKKESVLKLSHV